MPHLLELTKRFDFLFYFSQLFDPHIPSLDVTISDCVVPHSKRQIEKAKRYLYIVHWAHVVTMMHLMTKIPQFFTITLNPHHYFHTYHILSLKYFIDTYNAI